MPTPMQHPLRDTLSRYARANPRLSLGELSQDIGGLLRELAETGTVSIGEDKNLTGESLEVRTSLLLKLAGFTVLPGRKQLEDFTVEAPSGAATTRPLVIEVKSDRKPYIQRDDLRQLDDWVFDLSQEDRARKHGLGGGIDPLAVATSGLVSRRHQHPTPHKGILVFNGPVGMVFSERKFSPLSVDTLAFAIKRGFCVLPFGRLIDAVESVKDGRHSAHQLWEKLQSTEGEFAL